MILADEINRTPPKTQSALLEAMEERQLSVGGHTYPLPEPFFVLATQNPIEVEGTYPLPEAQLDRFLMKIKVNYPSRADEWEICRRQTTDYSHDIEHVIDVQTLLQMQSIVPKVIVADHVYEAAIDLARMTRPEEGKLPAELRDKVQYGAGPRASIALLMAGKARALLAQAVPRDDGRHLRRGAARAAASHHSRRSTPKRPGSIPMRSSKRSSSGIGRRRGSDCNGGCDSGKCSENAGTMSTDSASRLQQMLWQLQNRVNKFVSSLRERQAARRRVQRCAAIGGRGSAVRPRPSRASRPFSIRRCWRSWGSWS